jgi:putative ABC transport system substrate-binding protein
VIGRRTFFSVGIGLLIAPLAAGAQETRKIPKVGFLFSNSVGGSSPAAEAFENGMRERGWIKGENVAVEYRYAEGKAERFADLAAELVRVPVDVIVAPPAPATLAAKAATTTIPIVFTLGADPVAFGVLSSVNPQIGNITGLTEVSPELTPKRLGLLKEVMPTLTRVAILSQPGTLRAETADRLTREAKNTARSLSLQLQFVEVRAANELDAVFDEIVRDRAEALIVLMSPTFNAQTKRLADLVSKHRLPAVYETKNFAAAGGLISYGANISDIWRRSAIFVDKILKGAKPADLPIEQPTKFELVINLKTAKALSLTIPPSLLLRADQVIE